GYGLVVFRQGKSRLFCKYQSINNLEKSIVQYLFAKVKVYVIKI
ncbi:MAG: hypothetical protein RL542_751, partial [Bacteroidota bacterium]